MDRTALSDPLKTAATSEGCFTASAATLPKLRWHALTVRWKDINRSTVLMLVLADDPGGAVVGRLVT
ncbi:hypothetical protein ACFCYB_14500 [Streptomyces sp. NPDC056309]|uniref:hypothetical protein n=1 Tax=unclassified Streptomyces TaxID=2593676 RepID=UPI0035E3AC05